MKSETSGLVCTCGDPLHTALGEKCTRPPRILREAAVLGREAIAKGKLSRRQTPIDLASI